MARARTAPLARSRSASARLRLFVGDLAERAMDELNSFGMRSAGLILLLIGAAAALSVLTWSPNDPSLNNATGSGALNWLGRDGAVAGDLLVQGFGAGVILLIASFFVWGMRLLLERADVTEMRPRLLACTGALVLGCATLAAIDAEGLPLSPSGAGGVFGRILAALPTPLLSALDPVWAPAMAAALAGGAATLLLIYGLDLSPPRRATVLRWVRRGQAMAAYAADRWPFARRRAEEAEFDDEEAGDPDDEGRDDDFVPEPVLPRKGQGRIARDAAPKKAARERREAQATLDLVDDDDYDLPALALLAKPSGRSEAPYMSDEALEQNARLLETVLADFGVRGAITQVRPGPVVTLYELEPAAGIKSSRVIGLSDDIARNMSALSCRVAVVPGRNVLGIELPNTRRETVFLRELLSTADYEQTASPLALALGKDIGGAPVVADLAKMPHLLVAGTTGSGKSVAINTMILSLLYRLPPSQCRLIMIDPKMLELSVYDGIPHLLAPVVTEPKKAIVALKWTVREMEDRYRKMSKLGVRNIQGYNERIARAAEKNETLKRTVQTGFDKETGEPIYEDELLPLEPMPFIVVIVDEMADLMIVAGKEIEGLVQRLAQMARAAGIHIICATQRPSVDVITGTIKANFPTRISFQVTSKIDSRTILGEQGAEQLLGQGDMLYMAAGGRIRRVHGPFVSDAEVEQVVAFLKTQGRPEYLDAVTAEPDEDGEGDLLGGDGEGGSGDALYDQAVAIVVRDRKVSTSYIQRRLQIGYNRAARIIERMEEEGVLSSPNHQGKREILLPERD